MPEVSREVEKVEIEGEFRVCPACGYERGFHVSFKAEPGKNDRCVILICPSCGARYDVGTRL